MSKGNKSQEKDDFAKFLRKKKPAQAQTFCSRIKG